ncbi:uncharacterized protein LOC119397179 [Rhipicephalus sanguineus]|uniref:uncharacterized protein LOC119397179 n=1 Tax=Rhipicephalus sanguineus TaxID=34632 RepID=UPI0020C3A237|nr:uncharacterized protein LOC119397179 [Rhipicephalus sanguineus]
MSASGKIRHIIKGIDDDALTMLLAENPSTVAEKAAPRQLPHRQPVKRRRESSEDSSGEHAAQRIRVDVSDELDAVNDESRLTVNKAEDKASQTEEASSHFEGTFKKLSDREKLILDQCVMKANARSSKAVRYKKEWLYDCLLLKIKSTCVYTFLHENGYLPLPHPRTLYTYMRHLKAEFGFDETLFRILKQKLQGMPERERTRMVRSYDSTIKFDACNL